ncbi:MAG: hypothetical protein M0019_07320 [Actinomycetota bacterium]|nr:hypothetical protein [Actinomycetota bacterium]MDA8196998.1 hypothetical protein [Actinomycetota bacterium]
MMPEFIAYAVDINPALAREALIKMARRWKEVPEASSDQEILERLARYFDRQRWPSLGLIG